MRIFTVLLIIFAIFFLMMRAFGKFIASMRGNSGRTTSSYQQQRQRQNPPKKTETQEERIIDYQKKSFEATQAEDVDFEEIKE